MKSLVDLEFDYPTSRTEMSLPSVADRVHQTEVRLAVMAAEIGSRALNLFTIEQSKKEMAMRYIGELLLLSSRIFKQYGKKSSVVSLDQALELGESEMAREILLKIPFSVYEILTVLDEGASRAQAAAQFGLSEEYISENMRQIYEMFEVNKPGDALKAITSLLEARGFGEPLGAVAENSLTINPRDSLHEELVELSDTELDTLGCVALGLSNKQIAQGRFVTEQTVKFHLTNVYRKLGVTNRTAAATIAIRCGLIEWSMSFPDHEGEFMSTARKLNQELLTKERQDNTIA